MTTQPPNQGQPGYQQGPCQQPPYQQPYAYGAVVNRDAEHVKLLWIFHYVLGGITAFFGSFPLIHVTIGILVVTGKFPPGGGGPPAAVGWMFIIVGAVFVTLGWVTAILIFISAGRMRKQRSWTFCFVVACIMCLMVPLGTVLGVFTMIVLLRPSVKAAFAARK